MRTRRLAALSFVAGILLFAGSCGDTRDAPTAPSPSSSPSAAPSVADGAKNAASPSSSPSAGLPAGEGTTPGSMSLRLPPGAIGPEAVEFPPRDQSFDFGNQLNAYYRDVLRRSSVSTYVDIEGWIVWIQEYLRYRVNLCSHLEASFLVGIQIGGGGVPPVCGEAPPGVVNFPPRDQSYLFGLDLNQTYRDVLRRGAVSAYVDMEGWIVWIQEYLRYRVNGCNHTEATTRVFTQISGGGVQPVCTTAPAGTFIQVRGGAGTCACWVGTITVTVDGTNRGTLSCNGSLTVPVSPGTHLVRVCDDIDCVSLMVTVVSGTTDVWDLTCTSGGRSLRER